jgi:hypothetical protein
MNFVSEFVLDMDNRLGRAGGISDEKMTVDELIMCE